MCNKTSEFFSNSTFKWKENQTFEKLQNVYQIFLMDDSCFYGKLDFFFITITKVKNLTIWSLTLQN